MRKYIVLGYLLLCVSCAPLPWLEPRRTDPDPYNPTIVTGASIPFSTPDYNPTASATPTPSPTGVPPISENARRMEEYALYNVILDDMLVGGQLQCIVLKDHTTTGYLSEGDEKTMEYLRDNLAGISDDLLRDFFNRNHAAVQLTPAFTVDVPVVFISAEETAEFFASEDGGGWEQFYKTYEGAQGIMEVSQAGFNAEMDLALVYAGNQSYYLAGAGHLLVMEKQKGNWTVIKSLMVWIS